jgi:amino-acid N-acetyltransferase
MDIVVLDEGRYGALTDLFIRNELEFSAEEPVQTDILRGWGAYNDQTLIGGCVLALREGDFIIDGIAVDAPYRNTDVGSELLQAALDYAKEMGGKQVFLVARAPGFFSRQGFETIERKEGPLFFECFTCPQYQTTCFPQVMRIMLV